MITLPKDYLKLNGEWVDDCEDYAMMVPLVELSQNATYIPQYGYYHEPSSPQTLELREKRDQIIDSLMNKKRLTRYGY